MTEVKGIQETKEAVEGVLVMAAVITKELKNGFQVSDIVEAVQAIAADPVKKAVVESALKDIFKVPDEVKDLSVKEGVELAAVVVKQIPAILDALNT